MPFTPSNTRYFKAQGAAWVNRLIGMPIVEYDDNFFSSVSWCCDGLDWLIDWVKNDLISTNNGRTRNTKLSKLIDTIKGQSRNYQERSFEEIVEEYPAIPSGIINEVSEKLTEVANSQTTKPRIISSFQKFFGLDDTAIKICVYAFVSEKYRPLNSVMRHIDIDEYPNRYYLAKMLGIQFSSLNKNIATLINMGIFDQHCDISLRSKIDTILETGDEEAIKSSFCLKIEGSTLPLADCNVNETDREIVLKLFSQKTSSARHILLYGTPGTGKTTFARSLAHELNVDAWAVPCQDDDSSEDRRAALVACVRLAKRHKGAFVLVDEAEYILDTDLGAHHHSASPKAWLNAFLEEPGIRIIWITNEVSHIDQAVRRRFTYSINFPELGQRQRTVLWRNIAKRLRVSSKLSDATIKEIAEHPAQVADIENAMRAANEIAPSKEDFVPCLKQLIKAQVLLKDDGKKRPSQPSHWHMFDINGTCTKDPIETIVENCQCLNSMLLEDRAMKMPGQATMLFYGPPGTGKTELARYLAHILDRPCLIQKASDLLGGIVGETEYNIACAFEKANADNAVLLIDEADSFLQEREGAARSWEITMVNEFLTQLESCQSFCICTTNHRKIMDSAAMRRFSFKVEFTYANAKQLSALYLKMLAPLSNQPTPPEILLRLQNQKMLAPGDFTAVHRQFWMKDPATVEHNALLDALISEQKLKLEKEAKRLGF
ncbi:MAG: ATP-binding protein [Desulfovibrionaceae bacterium]|nr:ATP-binding protein [Desulfovibrionaceae bacterium]